ncbi:MAG TPA: creatininase family protein, partial [Gemmatirosa sp.]
VLLPVGAIVPRWAHLPVACDTLIIDHLADDLAACSGVLRAPTVAYGATAPAPPAALGATSIRKKTLHRMLNDLLAEWETHGVDEFVLLTAHRNDAHLEALATVITARARVRVVDALAVDCTDLLDASGPEPRDEETATSLLLHLAPALVGDGSHRTPRAGPDDAATRPPGGDLPTVTGATAEKGARIYARILGRIAERVLGVSAAAAGDGAGGRTRTRSATAVTRAITIAAAAAAGIAAGTAPARAQIVAVDEGSFVVTRAGATIGREQFRIVRQPVGAGGAAFVARSVAGYGTRRVVAALQTDSTGAPVRYQVDVRGDGAEERVLAERGTGGHFAAQVRRGRGEGAREYLLARGTVIVDDEAFHQLYFLARRALTGATLVPVLVPRTDAQLTVLVSRVASETVTIVGRAVPATHFVLADPTTAWRRDVWVDGDARVLRVFAPGTGIDAVREDPPR